MFGYSGSDLIHRASLPTRRTPYSGGLARIPIFEVRQIMKKAKSSAYSQWAKAEQQVTRIYAEFQYHWFNLLDIQELLVAEAKDRTQKAKPIFKRHWKFDHSLLPWIIENEGYPIKPQELTVAEAIQSLPKIRERIQSLLKSLDPFLSVSDREYTIVNEIIEKLSFFIDLADLLRISKTKFLREAKNARRKYSLKLIAYPHEKKVMRIIEGKMHTFESPLSSIMPDSMWECEFDESDEEVEHLVKLRIQLERNYVLQRLPGILSTMKENSSRKGTQSNAATQKKKELLFMLGEYKKWQESVQSQAGGSGFPSSHSTYSKKQPKTKRKRTSPTQWLETRSRWPNKLESLFQKHAHPKMDEGQEITRIVKYAQKIKRNRTSEGKD